MKLRLRNIFISTLITGREREIAVMIVYWWRRGEGKDTLHWTQRQLVFSHLVQRKHSGAEVNKY